MKIKFQSIDFSIKGVEIFGFIITTRKQLENTEMKVKAEVLKR